MSSSKPCLYPDRRAGRYTSEDLHRALFPNPPKPLSLAEIKEGIEKYVKSRFVGPSIK